MELDELKELVLVGGTNLALRYGHRSSIDIDLFGQHNVEVEELSGILSQFGQINLLKASKAIQIYNLNNIKVDFVRYSYQWIAPMIELDGIRFAASEDIAAMKIAAIVQRGSRKDFIDLYLLLQLFSLEEILNFYERKIADGSKFLALKSLTYFADAENEVMPKMFMQVTWPQIKKAIEHATKKLL